MSSMTGYGMGTAEADGNRVRIEIVSVNRKQLDLRINVPKELAALEPEMRTWLQERISRGCVNVSLTYGLSAELASEVGRVNRALAIQVGRELRELALEAGLAGDVTMSDVMAVPGVIPEEPAAVPLETLRPLVFFALDRAFGEFYAMRDKEGETLCADLLQRTDRMVEALSQVKVGADHVVADYRERLQKRLREIGVEAPQDDERLVKEVVLMAERSDITEETVRLDSHLAQLREALASRVVSGRKLEFLCQEMHREINTIGAKAGGAQTGEQVVTLKTELGRIKEQVMNLE